MAQDYRSFSEKQKAAMVNAGKKFQIWDFNKERKEDDLTCIGCKMTFGNVEQKREHVSGFSKHSCFHTYVRSFECSQCQGVFHSEIHLKVHKLIKHSETSTLTFFYCEHCGVQRDSASNLFKHVRLCHTYQCIECECTHRTKALAAKHFKTTHMNKG